MNDDTTTAPQSATSHTATSQSATSHTAADIEAIKQTKARYFRCIDTKRWDDFAQVFAEDAVMDMSGELKRAGADGSSGIIQGREGIRDFVKTAVEAAETVHHGHMPEINLTSAATAEGIWAMYDVVDFGEDAPFRGLRGYGHYHETYTKGKDGVWRIQTCRLTRLRIEVL